MLRMILCTTFLGTASVSAAKTPLIDSQQTAASACIDYEGTYAQIIERCKSGLSATGASKVQRLDMMWSLGWAYLDTDQYEQSEAVFKDMLDLNPDAVEAMNGLGWLAEEKDEYRKGYGFFQTSVATNPTASGLSGLSKTQYELGDIDLDTAIELLEAALSLDPDYGYALRERGWMLLNADQDARAETAFGEALGYNQYDENALLGMARALRNQDKYTDGLGYVNTLLDRDPDSYFGYAERALILFHLDRDKQAIKDADRAISMRPGSTSGYVTKARALSALGQRADALTLLDGALEKTGPSAVITYWQADLLTKDNRFADAVTVLNRSVERGVADHYDYRLMGYALIEQDKFDEARKVVDLALAESQTSYSVYLDAILMVEAGQMDDGVARFDTAMSKGLAAYRVGDFNKRLIRMGEIKRAIELRAKYKSASD